MATETTVYPLTTLQLRELAALVEGISAAVTAFESIGDRSGKDWGDGHHIQIALPRIQINTDAQWGSEALGWLVSNDEGGWDFTQKQEDN